jgi:hypothetical protein
VNGVISKKILVTSGVLQGSHLGPLLFNIFLNDVGSCFVKTDYLAYADDLKVWKPINSQEDVGLLQNDINRLTTFCSDNDLFLNNQMYAMNGESLDNADTAEDLRVVFDRALKFETHIQEIPPLKKIDVYNLAYSIV